MEKAVQDATNIRNFFRDEFKVPDDHLIFLKDKYATRQKIVEVLVALQSDTRIHKDDAILIYFAGHGSQCRVPKAAQPVWGQQVEMILPYDFEGYAEALRKSPSHIRGIIDVELGDILAKIAAEKGDNIVRDA